MKVSRPCGTYLARHPHPALKRWAILGMSFRDRGAVPDRGSCCLWPGKNCLIIVHSLAWDVRTRRDPTSARGGLFAYVIHWDRAYCRFPGVCCTSRSPRVSRADTCWLAIMRKGKSTATLALISVAVAQAIAAGAAHAGEATLTTEESGLSVETPTRDCQLNRHAIAPFLRLSAAPGAP